MSDPTRDKTKAPNRKMLSTLERDTSNTARMTRSSVARKLIIVVYVYD